MKKAGIVTLVGYYNYGNRLQNFALQEVLKSKQFLPYTVLIKEPLIKTCIKTMKEWGLKSFCIVSLYNWMTGKQVEVIKEDRQKIFKRFSKKYIKTKTVSLDSTRFRKLIEKTDYFFVGSDQVWNPTPWLKKELAFLKFCPKEKRIAYAASFGVEEISEEQKNFYTEGLVELSFISVREHSGQNIVRNLTGREASLFLDPTLMLQKSEWIKIESPIQVNKPYILMYFLGGMKEMLYKELEKYREEKKWIHMELSGVDGGTEIWNKAGPSEFLFLIHHAEFVLTDSFHGTVFSIIFHKNFYVFRGEDQRVAWFDRIQTLLEITEMTDRICESGKIERLEEISEDRWKQCDERLEIERKRIRKELEQFLQK